MKFLLKVFFCLFILNSAAMADSKVIHLIGIGANKCQKINDLDYSEFINNSLYSWISGYASAYNISSVDLELDKQFDVSFLTQDYVIKKVKGLCEHNPNNTVSDIAGVIISGLPVLEN